MLISLIIFNLNISISTGKLLTTSQSDGYSVILMIGDGMGSEHVKLAQWVESGLAGLLTMQTLPIQGQVTTSSADSSITDSAAAATAMATGQKTKNNYVSVSPSNEQLKTILEYANEVYKSTGVITTTQVNHATPAAFYSHVLSRNNYNEIETQLVEDANLDIILGGGRSAFTELELTKMQSRGYNIVENRTELLTAQSNKIIGLFTPSDPPYERVRDRTLVPSLAEMTSKSLEILSKDPDGFFLMVEGGQIDWAAHVNNAPNVALETIEFDKSVKIALDYVQTHENTILIVTADHETGGLAVISESLTTALPAEENTAEENEQLRVARAAEIYTLFSSTGHTATNVPFYMYGRTLSQYNNSIIDNTDIFEITKAFLFSDSGAPEITIHSPLNDTIYGTKVEVILSFNETPAWVGYSINDKSNLTVETTQFNLNIPEGTYRLNIYANDSFGNLGSAQVWFTFIFSQTTITSLTSTTTSDTTSGFIFLPSILLIILIDLVRRKLIKKLRLTKHSNL